MTGLGLPHPPFFRWCDGQELRTPSIDRARRI